MHIAILTFQGFNDEGEEAARAALHYVVPVGEKHKYVSRAMKNIAPYLPAHRPQAKNSEVMWERAETLDQPGLSYRLDRDLRQRAHLSVDIA